MPYANITRKLKEKLQTEPTTFYGESAIIKGEKQIRWCLSWKNLQKKNSSKDCLI